jgi:hypothetical protein
MLSKILRSIKNEQDIFSFVQITKMLAERQLFINRLLTKLASIDKISHFCAEIALLFPFRLRFGAGIKDLNGQVE